MVAGPPPPAIAASARFHRPSAGMHDRWPAPSRSARVEDDVPPARGGHLVAMLGSIRIAWTREHGRAAERRGPGARGAPRGRADRPDAARQRAAHAGPGRHLRRAPGRRGRTACDGPRRPRLRGGAGHRQRARAAGGRPGDGRPRLRSDQGAAVPGALRRRPREPARPRRRTRAAVRRNAEQARTARRSTGGEHVCRAVRGPPPGSDPAGRAAARSVATTAEGKRRVDAIRVDFDAFIATDVAWPRLRRGGRTRRRAARWSRRWAGWWSRWCSC